MLFRSRMMIDPSTTWGGANYTPLTEEQFNTQSGQWGQHLDYRDFSDMAAGMTGVGDAGRRKMGADPRFMHAYDAWQGADQSQGMENWMQNYNFDLAPERPEWQPNVDWQTSMANQQAYLDSPEYTDWQQRQEALGPVSAATQSAMMGGRRGGTLGLNSISPYIRNEGLFGAAYGRPEGQTPTYENYLSDIQTSQQQAQELANLRSQIAGQPQVMQGIRGNQGIAGLSNLQQQQGISPFSIGNPRPNDLMQPIGGLTQPQQQQALQGGLGALQGPTQQKIQQGLGSLGAGI